LSCILIARLHAASASPNPPAVTLSSILPHAPVTLTSHNRILDALTAQKTHLVVADVVYYLIIFRFFFLFSFIILFIPSLLFSQFHYYLLLLYYIISYLVFLFNFVYFILDSFPSRFLVLCQSCTLRRYCPSAPPVYAYSWSSKFPNCRHQNCY